MLAVDMSNYTSPLTPANLQAMKALGYTHAIIQAIDPPAGYPRGKTREQIQQCLDAGLTVDAYVWLWFQLGMIDIGRKLDLLDGLPIRQVWLDVEDLAAEQFSQADCEAKISGALDLCDRLAVTGGVATGIYSGWWYWTDRRYVGNTTVFSDRKLWDSNYDDIPNAAVNFRPYGGWTTVAIKQYRGTSSLAGISGIDLNVLSAEEEAELIGGSDVADCQAYKDALARVVNRLQIEDERKSASGQPAALRRTIIREVASEAFQALNQ